MGILLEIVGIVVINLGVFLFLAAEKLTIPFVIKVILLILADIIGLWLVETGYEDVRNN